MKQYILSLPIFLRLEQALNFLGASWGMLNNRPLWFSIVNYLKSTNSHNMIVRLSLDDMRIPCIGLKQYILTLTTFLWLEQAWAFLEQWSGVFMLNNIHLWYIVVNYFKPTNSCNMIYPALDWNNIFCPCHNFCG